MSRAFSVPCLFVSWIFLDIMTSGGRMKLHMQIVMMYDGYLSLYLTEGQTGQNYLWQFEEFPSKIPENIQ